MSIPQPSFRRQSVQLHVASRTWMGRTLSGSRRLSAIFVPMAEGACGMPIGGMVLRDRTSFLSECQKTVTWEQYLDGIQAGGWGDSVSLLAAAALLHRSVVVISLSRGVGVHELESSALPDTAPPLYAYHFASPPRSPLLAAAFRTTALLPSADRRQMQDLHGLPRPPLASGGQGGSRHARAFSPLHLLGHDGQSHRRNGIPGRK